MLRLVSTAWACRWGLAASRVARKRPSPSPRMRAERWWRRRGRKWRRVRSRVRPRVRYSSQRYGRASGSKLGGWMGMVMRRVRDGGPGGRSWVGGWGWSCGGCAMAGQEVEVGLVAGDGHAAGARWRASGVEVGLVGQGVVGCWLFVVRSVRYRAKKSRGVSRARSAAARRVRGERWRRSWSMKSRVRAARAQAAGRARGTAAEKSVAAVQAAASSAARGLR